MRKQLIVSVLALLGHTAQAMPVSAGLEASYFYARIDGFQQTPKGGSIGSTSHLRPSFDELNLSHDQNIDLLAWVDYKNWQLSFRYFPMHVDGQTILNEPLITHEIPLSAGRYFEAKVDDELYSLGFGYHFELCPQWRITPTVYAHWLSHDYSFSSPPFASERVFGASGIALGVVSKFKLQNDWLLQAEVQAAIPVTNLDVYHAKISIGHSWCIDRWILTPVFSVAWQEVRFKDNQTIPNFLKYSAFPMWGIGLQITT